MARLRMRKADPSLVPSEIRAVLDTIRKNHGENTVVTGSSIRQPWRIPTGIFTLDYALMGGIPHNRMTMFHGAKHSGKTTALLKAIRGAQVSLPDQVPVLVDIEGTYDGAWAAKQGVDIDQLYVVQPDTGEQAVDMVVGLAAARETSLIAIDSVAALLPMKEEEGSAEDESIPGLQAKLITKMLRKLNGALIRERKRGHMLTVVFVNQQRAKIGGWSPTGEALGLPGGKALGFFTSVEVRFKNKENLKKDDDGFDTLAFNEHSFVIEKNKLNGGMRSGEYRMLRRDDAETGLSEGDVDDAPTMLAFAKRLGWYTGGGRGGYTLEFADYSQTFPNAAAAATHLYENRDGYDLLRAHLIADNARRMNMPQDFIDYLLG